MLIFRWKVESLKEHILSEIGCFRGNKEISSSTGPPYILDITWICYSRDFSHVIFTSWVEQSLAACSHRRTWAWIAPCSQRCSAVCVLALMPLLLFSFFKFCSISMGISCTARCRCLFRSTSFISDRAITFQISFLYPPDLYIINWVRLRRIWSSILLTN